MRVGVLTGSGNYSLAGLQDAQRRELQTPWGAAAISVGGVGGVEVLHISRHGEGHERLSNHVAFQANVWAMRELGADAVLGLTACGAVDASVELGSLIVFDDLHFLVNRLPSGEVCSFYQRPGERERGHWIYELPYCEPLRRALLDAAAQTGQTARDGGCYGHVDGPRFNTRSEIRALANAGVTAVSQTGGPETVLCGEAELPYALCGYATDYANGVTAEATPIETLAELIARSTGVFAALLEAALPRIDVAALQPTGAVLRFD
jgi:5'-methylthioadenosine phosphorylase